MRNDVAMNPILFMSGFSSSDAAGLQRTSRSRERPSRARESPPGLTSDDWGGVVPATLAGGASAGAPTLADWPLICISLSSGRYSRLEPCLESTSTLVVLL